MQRRAFLHTLGAAGLLGSTGCLATTQPPPALPRETRTWRDYSADWRAPATPPATDVAVETVVTGLEVPWDVAFAPNGDLFVTERVGRIRRMGADGLATVLEPDDAIRAEAAPAEPDDRPHWETWWLPGGEGGVLGVAPHPAYPDPAWLYVYYTATTDRGPENRVVRYDLDAAAPAATATPIVTGIPADAVHNGGRLRWGPDNYLWVTTGDAGRPALAQDGQSLAGTVLRVQADGRPAHDTPSIEGRDRRIFTLGHRNPQGIAWLPSGAPVVTEHGPDGRDEVNLLVGGANYGWPRARTPDEYADAGADYPRPLLSTGDPPAWAPTGTAFYTGEAIPSWTNRLVFGQLFGQRLGVATITPRGQTTPTGDVVFDADWLHPNYTVSVTHVLPDLGRIRGAFQGPDGGLYAITSNRDGRAKGEDLPRPGDDRVVRISEP
jgi:glucose/arabinose dehydrogenase